MKNKYINRSVRAGSGGTRTNSSFTQGGPNGPCFVATACYGQDDNLVKSLRDWRDKVLSNGKEKGKLLFIHTYYKFIGKPGAWVLNKIPFLKPLARKAIKSFMKFNNIPIVK